MNVIPDPDFLAPFMVGALDYVEGGIGSPIPSALPLSKRPPLAGWTGKYGKRPTQEQVEAWRRSHSDSNVLLRLNSDVVGIDVDGYNDKHGADTFMAVSGVHGLLPATWRSSARVNDAVSGIRLYRLTEAMDATKSKGDFGASSDIEIIRAPHRFVVAHPSWHPTVGDVYRWYVPTGEKAPVGVVPTLDGLPYLPMAWWTHLTQECDCFVQVRREARAQNRRWRERPHGLSGKRLASQDLVAGLNRLAVMPEGSRNNYLSKLAGRTLLYDVGLARALDYGLAVGALEEAALKAGLDGDEVQRTLQSAEEWALKRYELEVAS